MHLNKELKVERDTSLIKILAFLAAMRFIVHRYEVSIKNVSDVTAIILCSKKLVYALTKFYTQKHMHARWEFRSYLLLVLQTAKIVNDSYRSNTIVCTE